MRLFLLLAPAALALVAGCGARDNDPGPGGVTVGEARALDEAAEMLEAKRGQPPSSASAPAPASAVAPTPASVPASTLAPAPAQPQHPAN